LKIDRTSANVRIIAAGARGYKTRTNLETLNSDNDTLERRDFPGFESNMKELVSFPQKQLPRADFWLFGVPSEEWIWND
jgi:hypothetical protein